MPTPRIGRFMHSLSRPHSSTIGRAAPARGAAVLLATLALLAPMPAVAQQPAPGDDASALSLEQLLDVEVESVFGASKSLQKITEAPASVTIVTADEIERFGWRTLADVLKNVRGFYVTTDRSYAYIGARGFQPPGDYSTRVLITLDGFRLNDNIFDEALLEEELPDRPRYGRPGRDRPRPQFVALRQQRVLRDCEPDDEDRR